MSGEAYPGHGLFLEIPGGFDGEDGTDVVDTLAHIKRNNMIQGQRTAYSLHQNPNAAVEVKRISSKTTGVPLTCRNSFGDVPVCLRSAMRELTTGCFRTVTLSIIVCVFYRPRRFREVEVWSDQEDTGIRMKDRNSIMCQTAEMGASEA